MFLLLDKFPNDTVWLLGHICHDGPVNMSKMINAQIFSKIATYLNAGNYLSTETACETASTILQNFTGEILYDSNSEENKSEI